MKKMILMLLVFCSLNLMASNAEVMPSEQPERLKVAMKCFVDKVVADDGGKHISGARIDQETGKTLIENYTYRFKCLASDRYFVNLIGAFNQDEKCGYQFVHELPNMGSLYSWAMEKNERPIFTRDSREQEFYMLCVKNQDDPRYVDVYTLAFKTIKSDKGDSCEGMLKFIISIRPEYVKQKEAKKPFVIEGMVADEYKDECEVVWLADERQCRQGNLLSAEKVSLYDGRFRFERNISRISKGKIGCLFRGEKEVTKWMDIKFIPGATMNISMYKDSYELLNKEECERMEKEQSANTLTSSPQKDARSYEQDSYINEIKEKAEDRMSLYKSMLNEVNAQIRELRKVQPHEVDYVAAKRRLEKLHKKAEELTDKMQELVEEVARELSF